MKTQQVDDGVFDFRRTNGDRLIADVTVSAIFVRQRKAQRIGLITFCQPHNRSRHSGRKQQRAARIRRCIENFFQVVAEAHVEHLVRFIEHNPDQGREV